MRRTRALPMMAAAALALSSCQGCKKNHPYVPYSIEGGAAAAAADARDEPAARAEGGSLAGARVEIAPPNASRWRLDDLDLVAPDRKVFAAALVSRGPAPGYRAALTVLLNAGGAGELGEVWVYRGDTDPLRPERLADAPPIALPPSCSPVPRLAPAGDHAVLVELGMMCAEEVGPAGASVRPGAPTRWAGIVDLAGTPRLRGQLDVSDPAGAPRLTLEGEVRDFDGDGMDDVLLKVTLEGGGPPFEPGPRVSASVRWLDRTTGLSREHDQPEASLHAIAASAAAAAVRPREAATVPPLVHQARALFVALCSEGRSPRLNHVLSDHAIECGTSHALEELALAEARAYVTLGDPLRAAGSLELAGLPPATHTAPRVAEVQAAIEKVAPVAQATNLRAVMAVPLSNRERPPAWGALAFEPQGKLLVRTPAGVARVDPVAGDETDAAGVSAWRSEVVDAAGAMRFLDVYDPCDGFALRATVASTAGNSARDILLPVAPRIGPRCEGARATAVAALPLAWGPLGLTAVVQGTPVLFSPDLARATPLALPPSQPSLRGAPLSPDGRTLVVPTSLGLLVLGSRPRLFRAKELTGAYGELYDCTVSDDATRVGCIRGGRAFVGVWPD